MGDLTANFSLSEFKVSSRFPDLAAQIPLPPPDQVKCYFLARLVLQPVRDRFKEPVEITSGKRDVTLNRAVKGVPNSAHRFRNYDGAIDFRFKDEDSERLKLAYRFLYDERRHCVGQCILYVAQDGKTAIDIHASLPSEKSHGEFLFKWADGTFSLFTGVIP